MNNRISVFNWSDWMAWQLLVRFSDQLDPSAKRKKPSLSEWLLPYVLCLRLSDFYLHFFGTPNDVHHNFGNIAVCDYFRNGFHEFIGYVMVNARIKFLFF